LDNIIAFGHARIFWGIYAVFLTALLLFIFRMSLRRAYSIWDYVDHPLTIVSLLGVWCYAFSWNLFGPVFWYGVLAAIILWDIVYNLFLRTFDHWGVSSPLGLVVVLGIGLALFIPEYIALYLYAERLSQLTS